MAVFNLNNYEAKDGFGLPLNIRRGNPNPLDNSSVWGSYAEALNYSQTDPTAYVGQILSVVNHAESTVDVYYIKDEAGTLERVGTSPVGDESTITVDADGTISLYGIDGLAMTRTEEDGTVTNVTYQPLYVNGKLTWVEPSATTVEGLAAEIEGLKSRVSDIETALGDETAGIIKSVADNTAAIAEMSEAIGEVPEDKTLVGIINSVSADLAKKVASVVAANNSVTVAGTSTDPTVAVKISADADNALSLAADGLKVVIPDAPEYSIVKAENSGDYAAIYNLTKDGEIVGTSINIPKDMVVESGSVVENPEGQAAGTYIKLALQNVAEPLYINVGSLIEYVTSGSSADDIVVISVSDDHKVTATITDGAITLAKLSTDIQTAIGQIHTHENIDALNSITPDNIVSWNTAVSNDHVHDNAEILSAITANKIAAWDGAQAAAEATAAAALGAAKTELQAEIDKKVDRVDGSRLMTTDEGTKLADVEDGAQVNVIDAVDTTQFAIADGKTLTLMDIAMGKVTGLTEALAGKVDAVDGHTLLSPDDKAKLDKLILGDNNSLQVSGSINAANVIGLDTWISDHADTLKGLSENNFTGALLSKLEGIEEDAQVNIIETIQVNGIDLDVIGKSVNVPLGGDAAGVVKSSDGENMVAISEEGTMEVNSINVNKLVQTLGDVFVINGGDASSN